MTNSEPLLSVVTIVLNDREHIRGTIESVLNQKCAQVEYVIVDGGSTDGTLEVITEYKEKIDKIVSERDFGVYDAINKGIKMCTGRYVGLINGGDRYLDGALNTVLSYCAAYDADVYYGNIRVERTIDKYVFSEESNADHRRLADRMSLFHPACFLKTSLHRAGWKYNTAYLVAADYDLLLRMQLAGLKFIRMPITVAAFRAGGISSSLRARSLRDNVQIRWRCTSSGSAVMFAVHAVLRIGISYAATLITKACLGEARFNRWRSARQLKRGAIIVREIG